MPVYTRILYPGSKRSPLEDTRKFFGRPECTLEQVYRALSLPATEFSEIQADMYKRSQKLWKRNTQVVYYTRRTTSLSGRRNADWCGLATAKRAVRCPLYSRGCSWTMTASRRRCASSRGTRRRPAHSSRWNRY